MVVVKAARRRRPRQRQRRKPAVDIHDPTVLAVSPAAAAKALDLGISRLYELIEVGELKSYRIGGARRIDVASIKALLATCAAANARPRRQKLEPGKRRSAKQNGADRRIAKHGCA